MPEEIETTPYFSLYEVVPGVYAAIVRPGTGAWGNAGFVDLGGQTLVFDTFSTPAAARVLRQKAEEVTGCAVTVVLNSHRHADHVNGNIVFADLPVVATTKNRSVMAELNPRFLAYIRENGSVYLGSLAEQIAAAPDEQRARDIAVMRDEVRAIWNASDEIEIHLPTLTFDSRITFHGSRFTAEFIDCGANHTPSDAVLWLPGAGVLFTGDIVQVRTHASMGQGDHHHWLKSMDALAALAPAWIVPGHGEVGMGADILHMKHYLLDMSAAAKAASMKGLMPEDVARTVTPAAYSGYAYSPGWAENLQALLPFYVKV